jgi:hypothetical protein
MAHWSAWWAATCVGKVSLVIDESAVVDDASAIEVGEYCRRIEAHLTKVNEGQIIRIVGPAFELARAWAREGVPLSVVCHGIDRKAERHRAGSATRALRLEFCEPDVTAVYRQWQRAVGLRRPATDVEAGDDADSEVSATPRAASPGRHLERAMQKLASAIGRLDRSDAFREAGAAVLQQLADIREAVRAARGAARTQLMERLPALDVILLDAARAEAGADGLATLQAQAAEELAPYRGRLSQDTWSQSLALSVTRLLRGRFGLPTIVQE